MPAGGAVVVAGGAPAAATGGAGGSPAKGKWLSMTVTKYFVVLNFLGLWFGWNLYGIFR